MVYCVIEAVIVSQDESNAKIFSFGVYSLVVLIFGALHTDQGCGFASKNHAAYVWNAMVMPAVQQHFIL